jgi:hypothetical protein
MYWWVSYGDKQLISHGTLNQSGWMTANEALDWARRQIAAGERVTEIRGPHGEVWIVDRVAEMLRSELSRLFSLQ